MARFLGALFLLSLVVTQALGQTPECSQDISDQCPAVDDKPVYFPQPNDCTSYCQCSGGVAWEFPCPADTCWYTEVNICYWCDVVDCGSRPIPPF